MLAAIDRAGVDKIKEHYKGLSWTRMLFDVWNVAKRSLAGTGFDQYSNGDNDNHVETALRKIGREAGLISSN
jgi:hypothetical protein